MNFPVVLVDIMKEVVSSMLVPNPVEPSEYLYMNFQPGRSGQIKDAITNINSSSAVEKEKSYPLVAMVMPVFENHGTGYHAKVRIERIVIATLTDRNTPVIDRYSVGGTFRDILYPCYYEFLKQLCYSTKINGQDPDFFVHTKMDIPGASPINAEANEVIDSIEILNLELTLPQIKTC